MKGKIIKILIITLMMLVVYCPIAYCTATGTVRMKIDGSTLWTNINVSESYEECLSLNSTTSTLGTSALEAHLTTDYDWSAMAVFSVSQYGTTTSNSPTSTNNNKSGLYNIGATTQTTGLLDTSTSTSTAFVYGLYDEAGNPKKYVNKINSTTGIDQNGKTCISFLKDYGTKYWLGTAPTARTNNSYPLSIKRRSI